MLCMQRQLENIYPYLRHDRPPANPNLRHDKPPPDPTSTMRTPAEQLDLATVIKLSQAISGEMVREKLINALK
jgi:hypothetical protein